MDKEDIINYVMETPENSNPAVLRGMLDSYSGGGGSGGGGSGGGVFWVTFTYDESHGLFSTDKTPTEICEAASNGVLVRGRMTDPLGNIGYFNLAYIDIINEAVSFVDARTIPTNGGQTSTSCTALTVENDHIEVVIYSWDITRVTPPGN